MSKPTTHRLATATLCGACLLAVPVANAAILSDLLVPGATLTVGPLTFGDFTYATACPISPATVTVTGWSGVPFPATPQHWGIQIQGPIAALPGQLCDIALTYTVTCNDPNLWIEDIYAKVVPSILGTGGAIGIGESVVDVDKGAQVATSTVGWISDPGDLTDPPADLGDTLAWTPGSKKIFVSKDIFLASHPTGFVGATTIYQGFSVPEPSTYAMLAGLGLVGFALYRRLAT